MSSPRRPHAPAPRPATPRGAPRTAPTSRVSPQPGPTTARATASSGTSSSGTARTGTARTGTTSSGTASSGTASTHAARGARRLAAGGRAVTALLPETITVRMLVVGMVLLASFVLLAPVARSYVRETSELRSLQAELAAAQEQKASLQNELERWDDPAFVKAQAREHLGYVMKGDTAYRVLDPAGVDPSVSPVTGRRVQAGVVDPAGGGEPWYQKVWTSAQVAGGGVTTDR